MNIHQHATLCEIATRGNDSPARRMAREMLLTQYVAERMAVAKAEAMLRLESNYTDRGDEIEAFNRLWIMS